MRKTMEYCSAVKEKSLTHNLVNSGIVFMPNHSNKLRYMSESSKFDDIPIPCTMPVILG